MLQLVRQLFLVIGFLPVGGDSHGKHGYFDAICSDAVDTCYGCATLDELPL